MHNDLFSRWHLLILCLFAEKPSNILYMYIIWNICSIIHVYVTTCNDLYGRVHWSQAHIVATVKPSYYFFSVSSRENLFSHIILLSFFSPNMFTLTKPDHDHGVSNTYEYAKQSLPGQSDKWNIHASDEHTYSNKSSMPHRQSMIFTQICSGTLMGQNKSTQANRPEKWETHKITASGSVTWVPEREQQCSI